MSSQAKADSNFEFRRLQKCKKNIAIPSSNHPNTVESSSAIGSVKLLICSDHDVDLISMSSQEKHIAILSSEDAKKHGKRFNH